MNAPHPMNRMNMKTWIQPIRSSICWPWVVASAGSPSQFVNMCVRPLRSGALKLRPLGVEIDVSDALRALPEIEEEGQERALHRQRDGQQHDDAELRSGDHRGLFGSEANRAGEDA